MDTAGPSLAEGIERSEATLAVTTDANVELLRDHLGADAKQMHFIESATLYRAPVVALDSYRAFLNARLEDGAPWVRILGEPLWAGRSEAEIRLWTRYESLLNIVFGASPVTVLCPYDERSLAPAIVEQARHTHPRTIGPGPAESSPEYADPGGFILEP